MPDGSILQDNSNKPSSMSQSGRKDIIMGESADIVTSSSGLVVTGEHNNMDIQDMAGLHELLYPRLSIRELLFADEAWEQGLNQLVIQHSQGPHLGSHLLQGPSPQPGQPGQQGDELLSVKCLFHSCPNSLFNILISFLLSLSLCLSLFLIPFFRGYKCLGSSHA